MVTPRREPAYSSTEVSVDRSIGQARKLLESHKAESIAFVEQATAFEIQFKLAGHLLVRLTFNVNKVFLHLCQAHPNTDQAKLKPRAQRVAWRQAVHYVKAVLEATDLGLFTIYDGFLAGMAGPDGRTLGESVAPRLSEWARNGPQMLLASTSTKEATDEAPH